MSVIYRSIIQGDLEGALDAGRRRFATIRTFPGEVHMMARILQDLGRRDEMLALCPHLVASPMHRFYAGFQLAASLHDSGADPATAVAQAGGHLTEAERAAAKTLLTGGPLLAEPAPGFRHIAICGTAFCGSTLFDILLNGLDGVRSIGESHWLTKARANKVTGPYDVADPLGEHVPQCRRCGPGCAVLTADFRLRLLADPSDWYARIARQLGAGILVSADKNLPKLVVNDPRMRFDALILYKSPEQAWASELARRPPAPSAEALFADMTAYAELWRRSYDEMLDTFRPRGRKVHVAFAAFAADPQAGLERVAAALDLPSGPGAHAGNPLHAIGGNRAVLQRLRDSGELAVERQRAPALPEGHAEWLRANAGVMAVHEAMNARAVIA